VAAPVTREIREPEVNRITVSHHAEHLGALRNVLGRRHTVEILRRRLERTPEFPDIALESSDFVSAALQRDAEQNLSHDDHKN
jgi:hypothetical protein